MIVAHLNNNQSKKKAWMREAQWMWHLMHTDTFANTRPVFGILETQFAGMQTSFGVNNFDNAQGPPV
jgi:hypothetical protein